MFLLDTNVISELRKVGDGRADANVVAWLSGVEASNLYVSTVTLMELERGALRIERRDKAQAALLRQWLENYVYLAFRDRAIPVNAEIALSCAALHVPDPRPELDALIAATALVHGMTLVTRNVADFAPMGVKLINPWVA